MADRMTFASVYRLHREVYGATKLQAFKRALDMWRLWHGLI